MKDDLKRYIEKTSPREEALSQSISPLGSPRKDELGSISINNKSSFLETSIISPPQIYKNVSFAPSSHTSPVVKKSFLNHNHSLTQGSTNRSTNAFDPSSATHIADTSLFIKEENHSFERANKKNLQIKPPIMVQERELAKDIEKQLKFPSSPAFINQVLNNQPLNKKKEMALPSVVEYCRNKNIPFMDEEDRYYKLKQFKQSHKFYQTYLNRCFETNRSSEYEIGVKTLSDTVPLNVVQKNLREGRKITDSLLPEHNQPKELFMP